MWVSTVSHAGMTGYRFRFPPGIRLPVSLRQRLDVRFLNLESTDCPATAQPLPAANVLYTFLCAPCRTLSAAWESTNRT